MTTFFTSFISEILTEERDFISFCQKEKKLRWFLAFAVLIFWGIKIINHNIFIDSEIMSLEPYGLLQSWYGSKRFGLILTKKLFHYAHLVPYLSNLLFAGTLWFDALLLCFCIRRWFSLDMISASKWDMYLLTALFISCPSLAEQFVFTLQAFEIILAMGFCIIAAFCADQAIHAKKSILWCCPALFFLVWSLGSYQSFSSFYIALVLISFLGSYEHNNNQPFRSAICHIALFSLGFILNIVVGDVLCLIKGGDSSYVEGMFLWGHIPYSQSLQYIWDEFRILFLGLAPALYHRLAGLVFLLSAAALGIRSFFKGWKWHHTIWYWLALLLLAASPMYISLITGMRTPIRAQLVFPLVFSFFAIALWHIIHYLLLLIFHNKTCTCHLLTAVLTLFFIVQIWSQGMSLIQLNQTLYDTYTHDVLTAERMYSDICHVADRDDMQNQKVVFVGSRDARIPNASTRGEVIGHSFFDFGITSIGVSNRVISLFNYLGMNLDSPSPDDYLHALEAAKGKPCWPAKDSIFYLNDCIVVKLSN